MSDRSNTELADLLDERAEATEKGELAPDGDKESVEYWVAVDREAAEALRAAS